MLEASKNPPVGPSCDRAGFQTRSRRISVPSRVAWARAEAERATCSIDRHLCDSVDHDDSWSGAPSHVDSRLFDTCWGRGRAGFCWLWQCEL